MVYILKKLSAKLWSGSISVHNDLSMVGGEGGIGVV